MYCASPNVRWEEQVVATNERRRALFFRLGVWFLAFSAGALALGKTRWAINSIWLTAPLMIIGMLALLSGVSVDWRTPVLRLGRHPKAVLMLLVVWSAVTIVRGGLDFQWRIIRDLCGIPYAGWAWVIPPMMLLGMNLMIPRQLLREMVSQGRVGLLLLVLCRMPPLQLFTDFHMTWGCPAALLFWHYLPRWARCVVLPGALFQLSQGVLSSGRSQVLRIGLLLIAAAFIELRRRHVGLAARQLGIMALCGMVLGTVYYAAAHDELPGVGDSINAKIQGFKKDLEPENLFTSRVGEHHNLYTEFLEGMSAWDLLVGRGAMGAYRVVRGGAYVEYRYVIECGYLQVVLKGGVIMLVLMLSLAIPAVWLGLFRSRNWFIRGFAFVVLCWLIEMVPFGLPYAFPGYLLVWIAIGACLNSQLRMLMDHQLEFLLLGRQYDATRMQMTPLGIPGAI